MASEAELLSCEQDLERAIRQFRHTLPNWWFSVGECDISCDASIAPMKASPDIDMIPFDHRFNDGFHVDLPQPSTLADALREAIIDAKEAIIAFHEQDSCARAAIMGGSDD